MPTTRADSQSVTYHFFFNDTATTEIYTLSLHDALPISGSSSDADSRPGPSLRHPARARRDRKSTRLNSSHSQISYAVFCLKKKTLLAICLETLVGEDAGYLQSWIDAVL